MHTVRNAPPTCALRFDCVGRGQGRLCVLRHLSRSLEFSRLEVARRRATNNDVMQIPFLSLSPLLPSSRGDSRERRFTIHLGPGEEKKEKEWTRHGIFFGRDRTGPKYGRPFEGREAAWRRNMLWPFLSFLFIFLERKGAKGEIPRFWNPCR